MIKRNFPNKTLEGDLAFQFIASMRGARPSQCGTFDLHDIVSLLREQLLLHMEELERRDATVEYHYPWRGEVVKTTLRYQLDCLRFSDPQLVRIEKIKKGSA